MLAVHQACDCMVMATNCACNTAVIVALGESLGCQVVESSCCHCVATGGEEEAMASYEEAMQAIFSLQLDRYSHVQPHRHPETGKMRWECIEMWPMQVLSEFKCTVKQ